MKQKKQAERVGQFLQAQQVYHEDRSQRGEDSYVKIPEVDQPSIFELLYSERNDLLLTYADTKGGSVKELVSLRQRQPGQYCQQSSSADEDVVNHQGVNSWQAARHAADDATDGVTDTDHRHQEHRRGLLDSRQLRAIYNTADSHVSFRLFISFLFAPDGFCSAIIQGISKCTVLQNPFSEPPHF